MMKAYLLFLAILVLSAPALGQGPDKPKTPQQEEATNAVEIILRGQEANIYAMDSENHKDLVDSANKLGEAYRKATLLPGGGDRLSANLLTEYLANHFSARSAPQVSQVANESTVKFQFLLAQQNQVLIDQNRRIIELLEAIAKKPTR